MNFFLANLAFFVFLSLTTVISPGNSSGQEGAASDARNGQREGICESLFLYTVTDRDVQIKTFSLRELSNLDRIVVDGYVAGIGVSCPDVVTIEAKSEVIPADKDRETLIFGYGRTASQEDFDRAFVETRWRRPLNSGGSAGSYFLFPGIKGDAVCPQDRFSISIRGRNSTWEIPVEQIGYRRISSLEHRTREEISFRYLGTRWKQITAQEDYRERIRAVTEGIGYVEKAFQMELVEDVRIVDFRRVREALTYKGKNSIWIYAESFLKDSPEELRSMAAHEALHRYVYERKITENSRIRELYAELKGYGPLSLERFWITMAGRIPSSSHPPTDNIFFSFIDEKNFLPGMKGGHSSDNLDEFCTSFLHSAFFPDLLQGNLDRPLLFSAGEGNRRLLIPREKAAILDAYISMLEMLTEEICGREVRSSAAMPQPPDYILGQSLKTARELRK